VTLRPAGADGGTEKRIDPGTFVSRIAHDSPKEREGKDREHEHPHC
jgi:hypothetical protein